MTITFVHSRQSFLPEIEAYTGFFESRGMHCQSCLPAEITGISTDIEWHFMGLDRHRSPGKRVKIHEYTSASTAPFPGLKDLAKRTLNVKPDFRIFLNNYVKGRMRFNDNIPFGFRDMGINASWLLNTGERRDTFKFDFVYIGDLSASRHPEKLLQVFSEGALKDRSLLIISQNYEALQRSYRSNTNIHFEGPFAHELVRDKLLQSRYAINYVIDKPPYNRQTSTKFLEYAACQVPVVSTNYQWIQEFQTQFGGAYYYANDDFANLDWDKIWNFTYVQPDLSAWTWENQIERSGILDFIRLKLDFPGTVKQAF